MIAASLFRRRSGTRSRRNARWKLLLWATLAALLVGTLGVGETVDKGLRSIRSMARSQPVSGDIVMVGIDDRSVEAIGQWPWPRRYHAQMLDRLLSLGARRVFFDYNFSQASNPEDDRILASALARAKGRGVIPTRFVVDPITDERVDAPPLDMFAKHATLANINVLRDTFGLVWWLPRGMMIGGKYYPSFAALLANKVTDSLDPVTIDYSFQFRSVRSVSSVDVLKHATPANVFKDKDVVIALMSERLGDIYTLPGQGVTGGAYVQVLGAETLKKGNPLDLGWLLPAFIALLGTVFALYTQRRLAGSAVAVSLVLGLLVVPGLLESQLIFVSIFPALLLVSIVLTVRAWQRVKERSATVNAVSGLPNMNALRRNHQRSAVGVPLVAARIQNYSEIASTLSGDAEELLIAEIAQRFELGIGGATLFHGDNGLFVWLARAGSARSIGDELEGLHALLTSPVSVSGQQVDLTVSFGIDVGEDRQVTNRVGSALVAADEAAGSGARWKIYDAARLQDAEWKLSLLGRLDTAIDTGEIWVAYQPKLHVASNRIAGAEALVRWSHPEKGSIPPDDFILVAEQHNRIEKLTSHVLHEAIKAAALINAHGIEFGIAVNLSARLLESPHLVALILELLAAHRLAPHRLTIEVTESAALISNARSTTMLEELRGHGINISIDDYGTGFSTLDYLRTIPATEIKIDKSFVAAMDRSQSDRLMVNSTIQLAHSLGRTVVAEGVETEAIFSALRDMGCDMIQGYLIGKPMKLVGLTRLLLNERRQLAA